ncbi:DUF2516 family protein [Nocardioides ferulae]|uniref:DUF2516 family protein n=1 Tax=Nocardioides ferulae TaxID=2340821 RepID=UPI0013DE02B8|nr:DUF2516 family protein [Nocardioides ferulae]
MNVFEVQFWIVSLVNVVLLAVKFFAFGSSLTFSKESYEAAGKLTKPTWTILLGLGAVLSIISIGSFLISLIFTVAAFVYLADVRPAMKGLRRR